MTINISSRITTLIIGSEDWSDWIESIQIGYPEYSVGAGIEGIHPEVP